MSILSMCLFLKCHLSRYFIVFVLLSHLIILILLFLFFQQKQNTHTHYDLIIYLPKSKRLYHRRENYFLLVSIAQ